MGPRILIADGYVSPELVKIRTPVLRPETAEFKPMLGSYTYSVSWEGIPAAELVTTVSQDGLNYRITANARTYSAIDLFYKLRYQAEGLISAVDYSPLKTTISHKENSRNKFTEIIFRPEGDVEAVRINHKSDEVRTLRFDPENFMLDPFAAAFLARSVDWETGKQVEFDTFNGQSRYLITLTALEKTRLEVNDVDRDVWVISPTVRNLTNTEQDSKLRKAKIYLTADKARDVLRIVSSVFIGSVYTELESIRPAPTSYFIPRYAGNKQDEKLLN